MWGRQHLSLTSVMFFIGAHKKTSENKTTMPHHHLFVSTLQLVFWYKMTLNRDICYLLRHLKYIV